MYVCLSSTQKVTQNHPIYIQFMFNIGSFINTCKESVDFVSSVATAAQRLARTP
jgi:hypothetical protein